mmetsp:Transcript_15038/g.28617  ORF Transcript_15038/g.28617 Transcript_15038/m.28617 type:complete len:106 (-) Transcript_15038:249-566(-)
MSPPDQPESKSITLKKRIRQVDSGDDIELADIPEVERNVRAVRMLAQRWIKDRKQDSLHSIHQILHSLKMLQMEDSCLASKKEVTKLLTGHMLAMHPFWQILAAH